MSAESGKKTTNSAEDKGSASNTRSYDRRDVENEGPEKISNRRKATAKMARVETNLTKTQGVILTSRYSSSDEDSDSDI